MERFWDSSLTSEQRDQLHAGSKLVGNGYISMMADGTYRFWDETEADSYGPYATQAEADVAQLEYAKTL